MGDLTGTDIRSERALNRVVGILVGASVPKPEGRQRIRALAHNSDL